MSGLRLDLVERVVMSLSEKAHSGHDHRSFSCSLCCRWPWKMPMEVLQSIASLLIRPSNGLLCIVKSAIGLHDYWDAPSLAGRCVLGCSHHI